MSANSIREVFLKIVAPISQGMDLRTSRLFLYSIAVLAFLHVIDSKKSHVHLNKRFYARKKFCTVALTCLEGGEFDPLYSSNGWGI